MRQWWRRRSVRARLTMGASFVIVLAMCASAALLVYGVHRSLLGSVDSTAKERAREAARLPVSGGVLPSTAEADNVVQIVDTGGDVVASTRNVVGEGRLFTFRPSRSRPTRIVSPLLRQVTAGWCTPPCLTTTNRKPCGD
jgi:hypothetical protein